MKFLGAFLATFFAIAIELRIKHVFGFAPDFALSALLVAGSFVGFGELALLVLFCVLILNWQPALSWEIMVFSLLPLAFAAVEKIFPFEFWTANLISVALGTALFTLLIDPRFLIRDILGFTELWLGAVLFGLTLYYLFYSAFGKSSHMS